VPSTVGRRRLRTFGALTPNEQVIIRARSEWERRAPNRDKEHGVPDKVETILTTSNQVIKAYRAGNPTKANALFAPDAANMARQGWKVQSQVWASEGVSMTKRIAFGLMAGSGGGTLTVTYSK
jgi:hypothetical protein